MIFDKLELKEAEQDTEEDSDQEKMQTDTVPNRDTDLLKNLSALIAEVISFIDDDRYICCLIGGHCRFFDTNTNN